MYFIKKDRIILLCHISSSGVSIYSITSNKIMCGADDRHDMRSYLQFRDGFHPL